MHKIYNPDYDDLKKITYYIITNDLGGNNYTATEITDIYKHKFNGDTILVDNYTDCYKSFYKVSNVRSSSPSPVYGTLHRERGPAQIDEVGTEYWYNDGEPHRVNGPCIDHTHSRDKYFNPEDATDCYDVREDTDKLVKWVFYEMFKDEIKQYDDSRKQFNLRHGWDEMGINWLGHQA